VLADFQVMVKIIQTCMEHRKQGVSEHHDTA